MNSDMGSVPDPKSVGSICFTVFLTSIVSMRVMRQISLMTVAWRLLHSAPRVWQSTFFRQMRNFSGSTNSQNWKNIFYLYLLNDKNGINSVQRDEVPEIPVS